jgi:F0F1-type ATP synthase assembly protein I
MAIAFEWSATIMTISAEMVVPGLLGYWVDQRLGTRGLFLIVGFALGGTLAGLQLMRIANKRTGQGGRQVDSHEDVGQEDVGQEDVGQEDVGRKDVGHS